MKHLFSYLVILFGTCTASQLHAQEDTIDKFIGIWHTEKTYPGPMKISRAENGSVFIQIKRSDESMIKSSDVAVYDDYLEFTIVDEVVYGKFWIGSWGGWYDSDREWVAKRENQILVGHDDGSYGTNGRVSGFYSSERHRIADKEIGYWSFRIIFRQEGNLELHSRLYSIYYSNDEKLFHQTTTWDLWADYTNW